MSTDPGLYLHVPFCAAICPYCDFAVTLGDRDRKKEFTRALVREIEGSAGTGLWNRFDTVYLGGGTPSALGEEELGQVLEAVRAVCDSGGAAAAPMVSIEANPEDVTAASARAWTGLGVDRLSLGVQSFDERELGFLGRRHTPEQALRAVEAALAAGMVVSIDLIYGLPDQGCARWRANLEAAVAIAPHHLSCYQLTIEPGTPFARRRRRGDWTEPGNDALADLFYLTHEFLGDAGYPAYEVSNFARAPRFECGHNRKYWEGASYLGLGPSAHSFDGRSRWWNQRSERRWRSEVEAGRSAEAGRERLTDAELALERLMLGLRTPAGIDLGVVGVELEGLLGGNRALFERFAADGLVRLEGTRLRPTLEGMARADALARAIEL